MGRVQIFGNNPKKSNSFQEENKSSLKSGGAYLSMQKSFVFQFTIKKYRDL